MTKVLFVIEKFGGDGPTRSLIALADAVARIEPAAELAVATLSGPGYPMTLMQARRSGLEVHDRPGPELVAQLIEAADVVVPLFWNSPVMYRFLRRDWPAMRLAPWLQINGAHPPQMLSAPLIEVSDTVICTARSTMDLPELDGTRTEHLPAFPNLGRLSDERPDADARFTVTYLGTINGAKMHPDFVSMSSAIDVPDVRVVIRGAGGGEGLLAEQIAESDDPDRFDLGGYVENIGAVLSESHVFGYPLKRETYATTEKSLIEAMAAGVCPVVFAHGGVSEVVTNGETGLVVEDGASYADAVRRLFDHPEERARLADAAQRSVRSRFDPDVLAAKFLSVVEGLNSRPRTPHEWPGVGGEGTASDRFIESLGRAGEFFVRSRSDDSAVSAAADRAIASGHDHLGTAEGGIIHYRNAEPDDGWLRYWSGLVLAGAGRPQDARTEFEAAVALDPGTVRGGNT